MESLIKCYTIYSVLFLTIASYHEQTADMVMKDLSFQGMLNVKTSPGVNQQEGNRENSLTEKEKSEGWRLLFDGQTSENWMSATTGKFPPNGWEIREGMLICNPATKEKGGGGDIVTVDKFRNFELSVDFRYTKGANSGIKYFVDTESDNGKLAGIGCEYQLLDDLNHPDAKAGKNGNRTLAGLYDLLPPQGKQDKGIDIWNRAVIKVSGNDVEHWLNGKMVLKYTRGNDEWRALVETSKFKIYKGFGEANEGRILLQDHGNLVYFKNIRIRELK